MDEFCDGCHEAAVRIHVGQDTTVQLDDFNSHLLWCEPLGPSTKNTFFMEQNQKETKYGPRRCQMRMQLKAILFASWAYHSQAMSGKQAFLQRMSTLAEAATSAAKALNLMASSGSGSSSASGDIAEAGLSMASRVLKNPNHFTGDDPHSFSSGKFGFCSWVSFGDSPFQKAFEEIEKLKPGEDLKPYSPDEQDLATKLYAVLTSD